MHCAFGSVTHLHRVLVVLLAGSRVAVVAVLEPDMLVQMRAAHCAAVGTYTCGTPVWLFDAPWRSWKLDGDGRPR